MNIWVRQIWNHNDNDDDDDLIKRFTVDLTVKSLKHQQQQHCVHLTLTITLIVKLRQHQTRMAKTCEIHGAYDSLVAKRNRRPTHRQLARFVVFRNSFLLLCNLFFVRGTLHHEMFVVSQHCFLFVLFAACPLMRFQKT